MKLGGDSIFIATADRSGEKIIILDPDLRILDTIKIFFMPGWYYAPRIAVFDGRGLFYSFSDDSSSYLYLYSLLNKSWKLVLKRPGDHLFLMKNRYIIFGDSLYKIEENFNIVPMDRIERPLLIESYSDENDTIVVFSYTSSGFRVNLLSINKFTEDIEKRKIYFGPFSYSDNVTVSPEGKIYFSIADTMSAPPSFKGIIKVYLMEDIRSNPILLYKYIGASDSSSLGSTYTALKYHNNSIYGAGYTQFLDHYSTFFTLFNIERKQLQSYIRIEDHFCTYVGEFGRKIGEIEYFSIEYAYGYGYQIKVRKYIPDPTNVSDHRRSEDEYILYQNYPNPFNPVTKIKYELKENGLVSLQILSPLGEQEVKLIDNEYKEKGVYEIEFDASKYGLSSGVYFYQIVTGTGNQTITKKMILIK